MSRSKTSYTCNECGAVSARWLGKCPFCGAWNSLAETVAAPVEGGGKNRLGAAFAALAPASDAQPLASIEAQDVARTPTGQAELDRALGGGIVAGGVVLIGGDPGIGKSTLLLQTVHHITATRRCLYVSGEESPRQIGLRAERLGLARERILLFSETQVEKILEIGRAHV